jgi:hypothetical protein
VLFDLFISNAKLSCCLSACWMGTIDENIGIKNPRLIANAAALPVG